MNKGFVQGIKDGMPICLGYLSVSFAFGIFAVENGFSLAEAVLLSTCCVTSAGQLAAVPIIASAGGFIELILSQLVINLRYSLMSVSLSQKLDGFVTLTDRFLIAFVNTDEVFAVASSQKGRVNRKYMFGLVLTPWLGWTLGTFIGSVAGTLLPAVVIASLGIAIYGMFIAIVTPVAKKDKATFICVLIAVALSCAFYYVPFLSRVPSGFSVIICTVIASVIMAVVAPVKKEETENAE